MRTISLVMSRESSDKKVVMVIAFKDFKDEEYFVTRQVLEKGGLEITTVSNKKGTAQGVSGGQAPIDLSLDELKIEDYDGLVFIGGPGCLKNLDQSVSYQIAQEAVKQDKVLGAICISPVILAKAGLLRDKKATVWSTPLDKSPVEILQENGADYQEQPVVIDGKIVTGNGPAAAKEFGQAVVQLMSR